MLEGGVKCAIQCERLEAIAQAQAPYAVASSCACVCLPRFTGLRLRIPLGGEGGVARAVRCDHLRVCAPEFRQLNFRAGPAHYLTPAAARGSGERRFSRPCLGGRTAGSSLSEFQTDEEGEWEGSRCRGN